MSIDRLVSLIDEARREGDYYFADLGKMIANSYGIAVSQGADGPTWAYDSVAASKQLHVCNDNMLRHKQKMIESGEWPSGT